MNYKIKVGGVPAGNSLVSANLVAADACETGPVIAERGARALCTAAAGAGYVCPAGCGATPLITTCTWNGADGFTIVWFGADSKFTIGPAGAATITNLWHNTSAGNDVGTDPLPFWLFEMAPGVNGIVSFSVHNTCGGAVPPIKTFTVDSTGKTTLQIASAVAAGFNAMAPCPNLPAAVYANEDIGKYSALASEFNCQFFVRVSNVQSVLKINTQGQPDQLIVAEGNSGVPANAPALSSWGTAAFVFTLLLTSLWFLRRRFRAA